MSKEKNLTWGYMMLINGETGPFVNCDGHTFLKQNESDDDILLNNNLIVIKGPAIDRLHEFEKLGMEPETIKLKIDNYKNVVAANARLFGKNMGLQANIEELSKENFKLKDQVARADEAVHHFQKLAGERSDDITKLKKMVENLDKKCTEQTGIILGLEKENANLKKCTSQYLADVCDSLKARVKDLEAKLSDRNDEIIRRNETHLRVLAERDRLARELDNMSKDYDNLVDEKDKVDLALHHKKKDFKELEEENRRLRDNMEQMKKITATAPNITIISDGSQTGAWIGSNYYVSGADYCLMNSIKNKRIKELKKKLADIGEIVEE